MKYTNRLIVSTLCFSVISGAIAGQKYPVQKYKFKEANRVIETRDNDRALPASVDLLDIQTIVKNQHERGTCAYFSTAALIESELKRTTGEDVNISEEFVIRYTKAILKEEINDDGSFTESNLGVYKTVGFALEKNIPYQPDWFGEGMPCDGVDKKDTKQLAKLNCFTHGKPSNKMLRDLIKFPRINIKPVTASSSVNLSKKLKEVLAQGRSVIAAVPVNFDGWDDSTGNAYYSDKLKKACDSDPESCGEHSVLIVGYDDNLSAIYDGKTVKGAFIFKNSWGADWGKSGYGKFPYQMIDKWADDAFEAEIVKAVTLPEDHSNLTDRQFSINDITLHTSGDSVYATVNANAENFQNSMLKIVGYPAKANNSLISSAAGTIFSKVHKLMNDETVVDDLELPLSYKANEWTNGLKGVSKPKMKINLSVYTDTNKWVPMFEGFETIAL